MTLIEKKDLYCEKCGKVLPLPFCCGQEMTFDGELFFCEICGKEKEVPSCCGVKMVIRTHKEKLSI